MFTCYLFDDFVATKASDKFSRGSHGEVSLQIDAAAIPALLHQVQPRHARPVLKKHKECMQWQLDVWNIQRIQTSSNLKDLLLLKW